MNMLGKYSGYNKSLEPGVTTEFSSAAFRFGHGTISDVITLVKEYDQPPGSQFYLSFWK